MVASSEQQRAPVMVSKPAIVHASSSQPGAPLKRADSAEVMKIPDPIIEPMTIIVASIGPSARTRPDSDWGSLMSSAAERGFLHLPFPESPATGARIRPPQDCRHEDRSFRPGH